MLLSEIYGELETGNSIGQVKQMIHHLQSPGSMISVYI